MKKRFRFKISSDLKTDLSEKQICRIHFDKNKWGLIRLDEHTVE